MSGEQRVTDCEWLPMDAAPKGLPTENVGCRDASEWFEAKPDPARYPFGAPYVVIRRRAWPQEDSWECNGEAFYVPDYFVGWRPLRTAHRATEAKLAAALAEVADFKQQLDQRNAKLAEAESDLAATKAKLEALEAVARIAWRLCIHVDLVPYTNSMGVTLSSSVGVYEELKERLAALTTKEAPDATR